MVDAKNAALTVGKERGIYDIQGMGTKGECIKSKEQKMPAR